MWIKIENLICNKISNLYSMRCYKIKENFFQKQEDILRFHSINVFRGIILNIVDIFFQEVYVTWQQLTKLVIMFGQGLFPRVLTNLLGN